MTANAPWSVKGIDAKAREVAKALARNAGMTLGEWLNQMILEGQDVGAMISRESVKMNMGHDVGYVPQNQYTPQDAVHSHQNYNQAQYSGQNLGQNSGQYPSNTGNFVPPQSQQGSGNSYAHSHLSQSNVGYRPETRPDSRLDPRNSGRSETYYDEGYDVYDDGYVPTRNAASPNYGRSIRPGRAPAFSPAASRATPFAQNEPLSGRGEISRVARVLDALNERLKSSETRSSTAVRGVSSAIEQLLDRLERNETTVTSQEGMLSEHVNEIVTARQRLERNEEDQGVLAHRLHEAERLLDAQAERLEGLSGHVRDGREKLVHLEASLDSAPIRQTLGAVEASLGKLANQLYENEVRSNDKITQVRDDLMGFTHRLAQLESNDPERIAQGVIDKVINQMAARLESAETRTNSALKVLEQALSSLDARISHTENSGDVTDPDQLTSLRLIGEDMTRRFETTRAELMASIKDNIATHSKALAPKEGVETTRFGLDIRALEERIIDSEKRQARAVEQMGQDVIRAAKALSEDTDRRAQKVTEAVSQNLETLSHSVTSRLTAVETGFSEGHKHLTNEMARISEGLAQRVGQTDTVHAQALERLGMEIARISERLNTKLTEADKRLVDTLSAAQKDFEMTRDTLTNDLQSRVKLAEERTQSRLDEARERIERQLSKSQTEALLTEAVLLTTSNKLKEKAQNPFETQSQTVPASVKAPYVPAPKQDTPFGNQLLDGFDNEKSLETSYQQDDNDNHNAQNYSRLNRDLDTPLQPSLATKPVYTESFDDEEEDPFAEIDSARKSAPLTTRSNLDRRYGAVEDVDDNDDEDEEVGGGVSLSTREALAAARAAVRASLEGQDEDVARGSPMTTKLKMAKPKIRKVTSDDDGFVKSSAQDTAIKALKASSLAALIVVGGASGYFTFKDEINSAFNLNPKVAQNEAPKILNVQEVKTETAEQINAQSLLNAEFLDVMKALDARSSDSVDKLKVVALKGYVPAQYLLGRFYEGFEKRVTPDKSEARNWYQKAAEGGERYAMYNLGVLYHGGDGGGQDRALAVMWFRKAAERGVLDAQYNLGALYQEGGESVPLNPSEAYKWFKIAAKSGDADAIKMSEEIGEKLSDTQRTKIDNEVSVFVPITDQATLMASNPLG